MSATKLLGRALIKGDDVQKGSAWQDVIQERKTAYRLHHHSALNELSDNRKELTEQEKSATLEQMEATIKRLKQKEEQHENHAETHPKLAQPQDNPSDKLDLPLPESYHSKIGYDEE